MKKRGRDIPDQEKCACECTVSLKSFLCLEKEENFLVAGMYDRRISENEAGMEGLNNL